MRLSNGDVLLRWHFAEMLAGCGNVGIEIGA